MSVYTHFIYINELITGSQLFYSSLMVGQRIVTHISITIIMIPLRATWVSAPLTNRNNYKSSLSKTVGTYTHSCERIVNRLNLRTGIYIINYRINLS